jgi:phosphate acetyltransferase
MKLMTSLPENVRVRVLSRSKGRLVALPESEDERVIEAANTLTRDFGVQVLLPGPERLAQESPVTFAHMQAMARARGKDPGRVTLEMASEPFHVCGALLSRGIVDAVVGGATVSTATVIRSALATVGLRPGVSLITSAFLMALREPTEGGAPVLIFADGAVNPQPSSEQLSDIAFLAADAFAAWTGQEPRLAFLSFSSLGSAHHEDVTKVRLAFEIFKKKNPGIKAVGEVQLDAAIVPSVATRKDQAGSLKGDANVLVFPDLDSANIGYKLTQRLAGAGAFGPILLGVAKPFSDLSRGASAADIVATTLLALALSGGPVR